MEISIVVAYDKRTRGIGYENKIPWRGDERIKEDMKFFRTLTLDNIVVMGRKTWQSLDRTPLSRRNNYVISNSLTPARYIFPSLSEVLRYFSMIKNLGLDKKIFIIGGEQLYKEALNLVDVKYIYVTELDLGENLQYDTFFPQLPKRFVKISSETKGICNFIKYENMLDNNSEEGQYCKLLSKVLEEGNVRDDRTGVGTISLFGEHLTFNLWDGDSIILPLLTTKKVLYDKVIEELLFFLRGDHDNRKLVEKGVNIWTGNTSREYLDKYNPKLETNDLGTSYGVQWRAAGAPYENIDADYRGKGIDQIGEIITLLNNDPYSRRIILNSWNVSSLRDMALVPCHMLYQFYVRNDNKNGNKFLDCMMIQRSADIFLGLPFNIASTALLTIILAKTCNMTPGKITINIGDAHIYKNHIEQVKIQLSREMYKFPRVTLEKSISSVKDIEELSLRDFNIIGYHCHPYIKAQMAV